MRGPTSVANASSLEAVRRAIPHGHRFALLNGEMAARKSLDLRPGPMPEITADGNSVTFHLPIPRGRDANRLVIRCDADGNVWAAIADDRTPR